MRYIFFSLALLATWTVQAQTVASEAEKQQVRLLLSTYEKDLHTIAHPDAATGDRNAAKRELLTILEDKAIWVVNDLDSVNGSLPISMHKYVQEVLPKQFPNGLSTKLGADKIQFGPVKQEKVRRYDYLEVRVSKTLTWHVVPSTDSSEVDTTEVSRTVTLSFFIRFNRANSLEKFKIFAICKPGTAPTLLPLPPMLAWWAELSPDWKAVLRKNCKMDEYPRESEVENLLAIRKLSIAKTPIKDATPLANFTELVELDCSQTAIADLSALEDLANLEDLNVSRTKITSLKGIGSHTNLLRLNCSFLKLQDIKPVTTLTKLEELNLSDNEVTDIGPVAGLTQLKKLNFNNNLSSTLTPLTALVNLEELRFGKNKVDDFSVLANFPNLVVLDCYSSGMTELTPLRSLPKLVYLNCGANPIASIDPISNHAFVVELNVSTTKIGSLSALRNFKQLEVLDVSNTTVTELGPVHDLGLRVLKCQLTKIDVRDKDRFKKKHAGCEITYF